MGELATEVIHIGLVAMMCNASTAISLSMPVSICQRLAQLYKTATLNALESLPGSGIRRSSSVASGQFERNRVP